jgi:hypothetical protein
MNPNRFTGILIFVGVICFGLYLLYLALPMLLILTANILNLGLFLIIFIIIIIAIFKIGKKLIK